MEIGTDLIASLRDRLGTPSNPAVAELFDWPGLHARLAAAHAARGAMAEHEQGIVLVSGSFTDWSRLADPSGGNASRGVNPMSSADGKIPAGMEGDSAGQPVAGGRG